MRTVALITIALCGILSVSGQRFYDDDEFERYGGYSPFGRNPYGSPYGRRPEAACPAEKKANDFCLPIPYGGRDENRAETAVNYFSWKLFKATKSPTDFALSPLSPQILLSYLTWVANGTTKNQLRSVSQFSSPDGLERLIGYMKNDGYSGKRKEDIDIDTAFFVSNDLRLNTAFTSKASGKVDIQKVDFFNGDANEKFNSWVKEKTRGSLKVDGNFDSTTRLVLASAIYFKAKWQFEFRPAVLGDFHTPSGIKQVPMMSHSDRKFQYRKLENYEWLSIPYKTDDSLLILLPSKEKTLDEVIQNIDEREFSDILNNINEEEYECRVNLTIPKFKIETSSSLIPTLQSLGVKKLFRNADLPYLTPETIAVSEVKQQTSIDVNEEGSILVSVTKVQAVALTVERRLERVSIVVDRPFIAMIVNGNQNVPYVIVKVTDPKY